MGHHFRDMRWALHGARGADCSRAERRAAAGMARAQASGRGSEGEGQRERREETRGEWRSASAQSARGSRAAAKVGRKFAGYASGSARAVHAEQRQIPEFAASAPGADSPEPSKVEPAPARAAESDPSDREAARERDTRAARAFPKRHCPQAGADAA